MLQDVATSVRIVKPRCVPRFTLAATHEQRLRAWLCIPAEGGPAIFVRSWLDCRANLPKPGNTHRPSANIVAPMILVFELTWDGSTHGPGNSHLIQMIAHAFPEHAVRVHAGAGHLHELRSFPALTALANLSFEAVSLWGDAASRSKTQDVSLSRFCLEFNILRAALAAAPKGERLLLVFASATSTAILAARLALRVTGREAGIKVGLHGNLNDLQAQRSRNPFLRALDMRAVMSRPRRGLRYLTFEAAIAAELRGMIPATANAVDSIPLAVNVSELDAWRPLELGEPLRVGLVGLATEAKGITQFLETARLFRAEYGPRIEFCLVGSIQGRDDPERFRDLAHPVAQGHMPRAAYIERLLSLHYVFLPLKPVYYRLSPSGGFIDALTWLKPVIATRLPIIADCFDEGGDIGHLCDDLAGMQAVLRAIMARPEPARYARQVEALRRVRAGREPAALAPAYRRLVVEGFPGFSGEANDTIAVP
jgi:hypothetical protein